MLILKTAIALIKLKFLVAETSTSCGFYQLVKLLNDLDEVSLNHVFIDGTKIEANANKYTFVWKKVVCKNEEKMHQKIKNLFDAASQTYLTRYESKQNGMQK